MKLTVLGNNGPYPSKGGATSGYLLEFDDRLFLLDCGSGVFSNLLRHVQPENLTAIIISHLHFDHVSDLGVLSYYFSSKGLKTRMKLFLPDTNPFIEQIINSNVFDVEFYSEEKFNFEGVTATEVVHPVKSFALTFYGDKVFTYTGDTNFCSQVERLFEKSDVLLCDSCFLQSQWAQAKPHMSVLGICKLAQKYDKKVILSHLNPQTDIEEYSSEAFGKFELAKIYQEIKL